MNSLYQIGFESWKESSPLIHAVPIVMLFGHIPTEYDDYILVLNIVWVEINII